MGYLLKAILGAGLFLGSVALFNVKLLELLETGTCASGGPYVSARPCPEGTGTDILLLMGSIFIGLFGFFLFAVRGTPPGKERKRFKGIGDGLVAWTIFFGVTGAVVLFASLTDQDLPDDGKLGGIIVGVTFLLMALPVLAYGLWSLISDWREPSVDERFQLSQPASSPRPQRRMGGNWIGTPVAAPAQPEAEPDDPIAQLERLQRLRESGALTEAEFEQQKRRVLGG